MIESGYLTKINAKMMNMLRVVRIEERVMIFDELESVRITDNADHISIPIDKWEKIKKKHEIGSLIENKEE